MRRALGRLLGTVLTLALTSVLAFAALSSLAYALGPRDISRPRLPLFVNTDPRNVHDLARESIERIVAGKDAERGKRELSRLGGAALPHVLPYMDTLNPTLRGELALALVPVARRMGLATQSELKSASDAISFWARFWQDRAFDFRAPIVRRLVARLSEGSSALGRDDILELDTYAAPELMAALGRIRTREDVLRAHRITLVLSHVLQRGPLIEQDMSVADARSTARAWYRFWSEEGADFITLDGPRRITAILVETRFGKWAARLFGIIGPRGAAVGAPFGLQPQAAIGSLSRYAASLLGSLLLACCAMHWELAARRRRVWLWRIGAAAFSALPACWLASWLAPPDSAWTRGALAVLFAVLAGAAVVSRQALASFAETGLEARPPMRLLLDAALQSAPAALPWLGTSLFALELCFALDGVAVATLDGLRRADVSAGMSLALAGVVSSAVVTTFADAMSTRALPQRQMPALIEVGGLLHRRGARIAAATALGVGLLGSGHLAALLGNRQGFRELSDGARAVVGMGTVTLLIAALFGLVLGTVAASGPRSLDSLLARATELAAALPTVLWAAALAQVFGRGVVLALALGLLRGVDVAWMLRTSLRKQGLRDEELAVRSLGRYPLLLYWNRRLRPAALSGIAVLALTPAWGIALGAAGRLCQLPTLPGTRGWEALLTAGTAASIGPQLVAAALLGFLTWVLLALVTFTPRRVGAFRSSLPPPPEGQGSKRRSGLASRP